MKGKHNVWFGQGLMYGFVISCFTFNGTLRPAAIKDESREMLDQILTLKEKLPPTLNISANISIYINPNDNVITPKANKMKKTNKVDPENWMFKILLQLECNLKIGSFAIILLCPWILKDKLSRGVVWFLCVKYVIDLLKLKEFVLWLNQTSLFL